MHDRGMAAHARDLDGRGLHMIAAGGGPAVPSELSSVRADVALFIDDSEG
jgi:hypothetical protein